MKNDTGLLLTPTFQPSPSFFESLDRLINSPSERSRLARLVRDERMDASRWESVFETELLHLFQWTLKRFMPSVTSGEAHLISPKNVVSLLPGYGFALHLLRRAVPFAALGIKTICGFREEVQREGKTITQEIAKFLNIANNLTTANDSCARLVEYASRAGGHVVVTGRLSTYQLLHEQLPLSTIGCTGHCGIVIGFKTEEVHRLAEVLSQMSLESSCSKIYAGYQIDSLDYHSSATHVFGPTGNHSSRLYDVIIKHHPSVLFSPNFNNQGNVQKLVFGYRLICCDEHGVPAEWAGFGVDPVGGWPGDYWL